MGVAREYEIPGRESDVQRTMAKMDFMVTTLDAASQRKLESEFSGIFWVIAIAANRQDGNAKLFEPFRGAAGILVAGAIKDIPKAINQIRLLKMDRPLQGFDPAH